MTIVAGRPDPANYLQPLSRLSPFRALLLILLMAAAGCRDRSPAAAVPESRPPATAPAATAPPVAASPQREPASFDPTPSVAIVSASTQAAGVQSPAYLEVEIVGAALGEVTFLAAQVLDDGRRLLVAADRLPNVASTAAGWGGVVHELAQAWFPQAYFLTNGADGAFVVARPAAGDGPLLEVAGTLRPSGGQATEVILRFDATTGALKDAVGAPRDALAAGDLFRPALEYLAPDDPAITAEPGPELAVANPETPLALELRPLPDGRYTALVQADVGGRLLASAPAALFVRNDGLLPGYQGYLNPQLGYQFLVPAHWSAAPAAGGAVTFSGPRADRQLSVAWRPLGSGISEAGLKPLALDQFGPVHVLYEEQRRVAGAPASWTAYGYEAADGPRTGILLTFAHEGRGYVVDMDAPAADEAETMQAIDALVRSWAFRPHGLWRAGGVWQTYTWRELGFSVPARYQVVGQDEGRIVFRPAGEEGFITLALAADDPGAALEGPWHLVASLTGTAAPIDSAVPYAFRLGGQDVTRLDLLFDGGRGSPLSGVAILGALGDQPVWIVAAAPTANYSADLEALFLTIAGDVVAAR